MEHQSNTREQGSRSAVRSRPHEENRASERALRGLTPLSRGRSSRKAVYADDLVPPLRAGGSEDPMKPRPPVTRHFMVERSGREFRQAVAGRREDTTKQGIGSVERRRAPVNLSLLSRPRS